ncbi:MAG: helix-hairpin-helix domain-containing protein [Hyphomicrobiaceae bacterium]|nr:helix-hairpin-helix domain-containing protein [Hyphomicrobiaceae bacterium]
MASFSSEERDVLLAVKGVGPTVVMRLEQMGISSLKELGMRQAETICAEAAASLGSTCWKNSPQAKSAIAAAIAVAKIHTRPKRTSS